tara:strand:+ start:172 stop:1164 length:993 start_codon:yes stop_codon:yes gene_type:complete
MILKSYEIKKIDLKKSNFILFYGKNEGYKKEAIKFIVKNKDEISNYDEKEILDNEEKFIENLLSKSLFENEKIIIIKRASDKIFKIINEINAKKIEDLIIIVNAENLEKKSKLRLLFEKDKKFISVPFYPDNEQILSKLTYEFLKEKKISMSQSNINLIVNRCSGDREKLLNEIGKIEHFGKNGKKITTEHIAKLTNLSEDHSVSELIDNCLAKNKRKTINILNENNFNNEDCILIARTFLNKSKKLLKLSIDFEQNNNLDLTISSAKPPVFWKDKEVTKQQISKWTSKNVKKLIYKLNEIELLLKKNINNSINLITDFLLEQSSSKTNN